MRIMTLFLLCYFSIGHGAESEKALLLLFKKLETNYVSTIKSMKRPDVLKSPSAIHSYMHDMEHMPEIALWNPQKEARLLEETGVSAQQLCESPNMDTQSTIFLKLARAFNLVYSAWFRLRCIELHKSAVLYNEQRSDKLLPSTIQKQLELASKANLRSEFHKQRYLEYNTALGNQAGIGILLERKLPAYNYVDDQTENLKVLFKGAAATLKSITEGWDGGKETGSIEYEKVLESLSRLRIKTHVHVSQVAQLLEKWKGLITREKLELSKEYHLYLWMLHHLEYLKVSGLAQFHLENDVYEYCTNKAMSEANRHQELYKESQKALENYESRADIVEGPESHCEIANPASVHTSDIGTFVLPDVELGMTSGLNSERDLDSTLLLDLSATIRSQETMSMNSVQQSTRPKFSTQNYFDAAHESAASERLNLESNNENDDLQLNLCLGPTGMKRLHDTIEMEPVKSKRTKLNTESYFNGAHGLTPEEFNLNPNNENDDLQLNLCLGPTGINRFQGNMAMDSVQQ